MMLSTVGSTPDDRSSTKACPIVVVIIWSAAMLIVPLRLSVIFFESIAMGFSLCEMGNCSWWLRGQSSTRGFFDNGLFL